MASARNVNEPELKRDLNFKFEVLKRMGETFDKLEKKEEASEANIFELQAFPTMYRSLLSFKELTQFKKIQDLLKIILPLAKKVEAQYVRYYVSELTGDDLDDIYMLPYPDQSYKAVISQHILAFTKSADQKMNLTTAYIYRILNVEQNGDHYDHSDHLVLEVEDDQPMEEVSSPKDLFNIPPDSPKPSRL